MGPGGPKELLVRVIDAYEYTVDEGNPGLFVRMVVEVIPEPDLLMV